MALHKMLSNFSGGEISPQLDARIDLAKYDLSCRKLENMRPLPWGGVTFRAGTLFIAEAKFSDRPFRLIPFNFSTSITYMIEVGDLYMRFYYGTGIQIATTTADADFWRNTNGYVIGNFVQWHGVVYRCSHNVASTVPPQYNISPEFDTAHWDAQSAYEIATPYTAAEVFGLQFKEINDVVRLVHPNHAPQVLTRTSPTSFTIAPIAWKYPALLDENTDSTTTLTLGALTGSTTLTASVPLFSALHVGSYWEVRHLRDAGSQTLDISGTSGTMTGTAIEVVGDWTLITSQNWFGVLQVQRSIDGGTTWTVAREFKSKSDHNVSVSGTEDAPDAGKPRTQLRLFYTATGNPYGSPPWVGTAPNSYVLASATLDVADAYIAALVKVTAFTSTTIVTVTVINAAAATTPSTIWAEGAWSAFRGYPRAIGLYEQRVLYAGTIFQPNTVWGSVTADFDNFLYSDQDDGAVAYQPATCEQNPAAWLESLEGAFLGTSGEEMAITSGNTNEALTPSNVTIRAQSANGSAAIQPLVVGKAILFVERQGLRIRELMEGNPFLEKGGPAPIDLTLLAEHITAPGLTQLAFAKQPDQQVYATRADGRMVVMTYNKEQNINAWARYLTNGNFDTVASVYGTPADVVFVGTTRATGNGLKKYIEVFTAETTDKTNGIVGMDCSTLVTQAPSNIVKVGSFLEGMDVAVVADGQVVATTSTGGTRVTVTGGQITLPDGLVASTIRVGLPYFGTLQPMKLDSIIGNGTSQGRRRRISELCIRFKDTLGCVYGNRDRTALNIEPQQYSSDIPFRNITDLMDTSPPLFTGDKVLPWEAGNDLTGDIMITQGQPMPMTILGLFAKMDIFGE